MSTGPSSTIVTTILNFRGNNALQVGQNVAREATQTPTIGTIILLAVRIGSVTYIVGLIITRIALSTNCVSVDLAVHIYESGGKTGHSAGEITIFALSA